MKRLLMLAIPLMLCFGAFETIRAEEKIEVKESDNGKEYKLKIKRHGDDGWVGMHEKHEYQLRGDVVKTTVKDEGEYTVWGKVSDDNTYITTTKITRVETK